MYKHVRSIRKSPKNVKQTNQTT